MSVEVTLVCDRCSGLIDSGTSARVIRAEAKTYGCRVGMPGGKDWCSDCALRPGKGPVYAFGPPPPKTHYATEAEHG